MSETTHVLTQRVEAITQRMVNLEGSEHQTTVHDLLDVQGILRDLSAALVQAEQQYDTAQHNVLAYLERNHDLEDRLQAQEATIRQVVEELRAEFLFKWADTLATLLPAEQTGEQ